MLHLNPTQHRSLMPRQPPMLRLSLRAESRMDGNQELAMTLLQPAAIPQAAFFIS
jgi:hypothetical protein